MKAMLAILVHVVAFSYWAAALLYFGGLKKERLLKAAFALAGLGCIFHLAVLAVRTLLAGMLPLTNGLEFLLSFTWFTVFMYLLFTFRCRINTSGGVVMLFAAMLVSLAVVFMKDRLGAVAPLAPALQSPWLTVHVVTAAAAYAAFTLAAGLAVMQFFKAGHAIRDEHLNLLVGGGFALLSLSIVLGAAWAEQAWGRYWSWDPKETWALVTWIIYALYLHLHRSREWPGNHARLVVIAGFVLVLFTFFGVNYWLPGLHSYA